MRILFIHGANSTQRSFAWLAPAITDDPYHFEYDTNDPAFSNIARCQETVDKIKPDVVIGHSLGGVMAAYLKTDAKIVTIAAPFGGSAIANWLPSFSQLMRDVATTSPLIRGLRNKAVDGKRFLSIVANGLDGGGWDGVLSHSSQTALKGPTYVVRDLNHFEVLVDEKVLSVIGEFLCPPVTS